MAQASDPPMINGMMMVASYALLTLASARLTRLIVVDKIAVPIRRAVIAKAGGDHWLSYLLHCPYCVSVWTSAAASALWVLTWLPWEQALIWWVPALLAMSYLVAPVLIRFESED